LPSGERVLTTCPRAKSGCCQKGIGGPSIGRGQGKKPLGGVGQREGERQKKKKGEDLNTKASPRRIESGTPARGRKRSVPSRVKTLKSQKKMPVPLISALEEARRGGSKGG